MRLAELSAFGAYVAVDEHAAGSPPTDGWRPLSALVSSPDALAERADVVAAALGTANRRVSVSIAHLGYAARLLSPVLAAQLLGGSLSWDTDELWWRAVAGGPLALSVSPSAGAAPRRDDALADAVTGPVDVLGSYACGLGCPAAVVRGNVASALNGVAVVVARVRPDLHAAACAAVDRVLAESGLAGAVTGVAVSATFRRRSCCLIWQAAGSRRGNLCADCVLA